ncbi:MAG: kinase [Betaproteobacteria bacterium RIFCSPLOWO2_02_FULL_67_26]|nr:MAG: kinase [Betaproteobacteria bacterium RIFCSPLOWO2_02_FULL_67_26]
MIISRTPFRISFFGGGTDYPDWYRRHGGAVLATTINKYCYISCRYLPPFFDHKYRVVYSRIEDRTNVDEILHPPVREALRYLNFDQGVEIHHDGDLPARSGLGSSSAFTVGLLNALYALRGVMVDKAELARKAIHIEQERLNEAVGSQDQTLAAYGGLSHIEFLQNGEISVQPLTLRPDHIKELSAHLMLFFTGISRTASAVVKEYLPEIVSKERQLGRMREMVDESLALLRDGGDLVRFGRLLHESWTLKRSLSPKISTSYVDQVYEAGLSAGALGGKLIGAGGGGFVLLFVPPDRQPKVMERLRDLVHVPIKFEFSGSRIIFFDPEEDFTEQARLWEERSRQAQRPEPAALTSADAKPQATGRGKHRA